MKVRQIMDSIIYTGSNDLETLEIGEITCDSRRVMPGMAFVCVKGGKMDGHDHAAEAVNRGAAVVVAEHDVGLECQLVVENTRHAYAVMCANFYGNPSRKLKLIGVTGTNGKTTITNLLKHILEYAGYRVGLIGTIQNEIDDMALPAKYTTPDPAQLHALFARMAAAKCDYVVMEVSSHALDQDRVAGCQFEAAVFTNLTQDHLDYHGTMENYFQAKKKLFSLCKVGIINYDDSYGRRIMEEAPCPIRSFSVSDDVAEYTAKNITISEKGSRFAFLGTGIIARIDFPMPGMFSVSNAMAAAACAVSVGIPLDKAAVALNSCPGVCGRTQILKTDTPFTVIDDYAHTPDAIEKILAAVREFASGRIMILFGCAGNRDGRKRPLMAAAAAKGADFVILTSDNPRSEDPVKIIQEALPGFEGFETPYVVIPDRYQAIRWALENAKEGDVLLLAGKGHEDYQVLDYGTIWFDERHVVQELLEKINTEGKKAVLPPQPEK
jgi:UDP-N-acetylmuramoyl-L-alanyl-D-glutamate--2,6-diaminopimelate ligase